MEAHVIAATRAWVKDVVIGLDLCPFAAAVFEKRLRFHVSDAQDAFGVMETLVGELVTLADADPEEVATTLVMTPRAFPAFETYAAFLHRVDLLLEEMHLKGVIQVASFHPEYRFAGATDDDAANYTNRSPYPTFHLIRETSVSEAVTKHPDTLAIPEANIVKLQAIGAEEMAGRLRACHGRET